MSHICPSHLFHYLPIKERMKHGKVSIVEKNLRNIIEITLRIPIEQYHIKDTKPTKVNNLLPKLLIDQGC